MTDKPPPTRYRFAPQDRTGWLLGLTGVQCVLLAGGLTVAALVLPVSPAASLAAVLCATVTAFASWDQQPAHQHATRRAAWTTRRVRGSAHWTSPQPFHARLARSPQLPDVFGRLRFWTTTHSTWPGDPIAVIEDRAEHTFTIVVPVAGRGFALLEPGDQERLLAGWGDLLGGFTSTRNPAVRLTVSEWAGAATTAEPAEPAATSNPVAVHAYNTLVAAAGPSSNRHETLLALTVTAPRTGRRQWGRPAAAAGVTVAVEQARLLAARLDNIGIDPRPPFDTHALAALLRRRLDPAGRPSPRSRFGNAGPMAMRSGWEHVQVDGSAHAVFWIAEWPRLPVTAGWLEPLLLHAAGTRTFTLLVEPVAASQAARQVRRDATRLAADQEQRERSGWRVGADHHRARAEVEQRETELASGYAELDYLGLLTVTAPNPSVLAESCRELEDIAGQTGVQLRRLDGRHDQALPAGLGFLGRPVPRPRLR